MATLVYMTAINRILCFFYFFAILLGVCVFYLFAGSLNETILDIRQKERIRLLSAVPEGWAFFTRDPKEEYLKVYEKTGDKWSLYILPTGAVSNILGLSRKTRFANQELGVILPGIKESDWRNVSGDYIDSLNSPKYDTIAPLKIKAPSRYPLLSGTYILQKIKPIPYAWFKSDPGILMDSRICKIEVIKQ
jgi:antimicrobial peptide system SdpA family protein